MLTDDPKDRPDEPELELVEDEEVEEEETEEPEADKPEAEEPEPKEESEQPAEDEDDDLPDDPKALKRMVRQTQLQHQQLLEHVREGSRRQPPTGADEPDEIGEALAELEKDPSTGAIKALGVILKREKQREIARQRDEAADAALASIPEEDREDVKAISKRFNLPIPAAKMALDAAKWQRLQQRRATKQKSDTPTAEPSRPQGKAPQTRPVRRGSEPANGAGYIVVEGLKIKTKQKPGEYSLMMDKLPVEARRKVYALKKDGKITVE